MSPPVGSYSTEHPRTSSNQYSHQEVITERGVLISLSLSVFRDCLPAFVEEELFGVDGRFTIQPRSSFCRAGCSWRVAQWLPRQRRPRTSVITPIFPVFIVVWSFHSQADKRCTVIEKDRLKTKQTLKSMCSLG